MRNNNPINITLVGCGASGSAFAYHLARLQLVMEKMDTFFNVTLLDKGDVRENNLGKQSFSPAALGMNKACALAMQVNRLYGTNWVGHHVDVTEKDFKCNPDIIISAVDSVEARKAINVNTTRHYWLDMGNLKEHGQVILAYTAKTDERLPSIIDLYPNMEEDPEEPSCSVFESIGRQALFVNDMAAVLAGVMLSDLLIKKKLNYSGYYFNINNCMLTKIPITKWQKNTVATAETNSLSKSKRI